MTNPVEQKAGESGDLVLVPRRAAKQQVMAWFQDRLGDPNQRRLVESIYETMVAASPIANGLVALPGHVPMPRTLDEAKGMWLIGERWVRDNAPNVLSPSVAVPVGGEGTGATPMGSGSQASPEAPTDPRPTGVDPSRERPWQPWERSYSGNRVGVRTDGDWTILHILSGGAETTTSIREHEAWDLAMRASPKLAALFKGMGAENRKMRDALFKLGSQCRQANIEELREAAEEVDCGDGCSNHFYDGSCNAHECHRENTDGGCSWQRAESLRDLATALETQAEVEASVRDRSGEAAETSGSADRQEPGPERATPDPDPITKAQAVLDDSTALRARIGELERDLALKERENRALNAVSLIQARELKRLDPHGQTPADLDEAMSALRSALSHPIPTTQTEEAGNG